MGLSTSWYRLRPLGLLCSGGYLGAGFRFVFNYSIEISLSRWFSS